MNLLTPSDLRPTLRDWALTVGNSVITVRIMTSVDQLQQQAVDAMTPAERIARSAQLWGWTYGVMERQVRAQHGAVSPEVIKCLVALRMYGHDPEMRRLIEEQLTRVSH